MLCSLSKKVDEGQKDDANEQSRAATQGIRCNEKYLWRRAHRSRNSCRNDNICNIASIFDADAEFSG